MGLFSKKKPAPLPEITYDEVVDYLRDLAQPDYTKILKVVGIYRDADKGVKKVLNIKPEPVEDGFTDEELDEIFLTDDQPKTKAKKVEKKK